MVKRCCAYGCRNSTSDKDKKVSFHMFPVDPVRRVQWTDAVGRIMSDGSLWVPLQNSVLCGNHFVKGRPSKDSQDVDFIPTQFDFSSPISKRGVKIHKGQIDQLMDGTLYTATPSTSKKTSNKDKIKALAPPTKPHTIHQPMFASPSPLNISHDFTKSTMVSDVSAPPIQMQHFAAAMQNHYINYAQSSGLPASYPSMLTVPAPNAMPMNPMMGVPGMPPMINPIIIQPDAPQLTSQALFTSPWPSPIQQSVPSPMSGAPTSLLASLHQPFNQPLPPPPVTSDTPAAPSDPTPTPLPSTSKKPDVAKKVKAKYVKIRRLRLPGPKAVAIPEYKEPIYELSVEGEDESHKIKLSRSSQSFSYKEHSYRDPEIQNLFRAGDLLEKRRSFFQAAFEVLDICA